MNNNNNIKTEDVTKKLTKEQLRQKLRHKMQEKRLGRKTKIEKNNQLNNYAKKLGVNESDIEKLKERVTKYINKK